MGLIKNNLKLMLRSKWIIIIMSLLPLMTIALLSGAFESMMDMDYTIEPFRVGYRMAENCRYEGSMELLSDICRENDISLSEFPGGDIETLIAGGNADIFVTIEDNHLTIYQQSGKEAQASMVESIFSSVFSRIEEVTVLLSYSEMPANLLADMANPAQSGKLSTLKLNTDPVPSARNYYGIIEIVYFTWCGCISLAAVIPSERKNRINARLRMTPATKMQLYLGKFVPCLLAIGIEISAAMILSIFFMDVHWGNWPGSLLILSLLALAATAFGMILFTLFSNTAVSVSVGWIVMFVNGFLGGSFQTYIYSTIPDTYARLAPQYYINRTLVEFSTKGSSDYALPCVIILCTIFLVCIAVGFPIMNRKEGSAL